MDFENPFAILFFFIGAIFSLMDIGSDSYLAYEYWNKSDYQSFEHCVEFRLSVFKEKDQKSLRQIRDDYCENWKEKRQNASLKADSEECLRTLLTGTNVTTETVKKQSQWLDDDFKEHTLDEKELQWMKAFCTPRGRWSANKLQSAHEQRMNSL